MIKWIGAAIIAILAIAAFYMFNNKSLPALSGGSSNIAKSPYLEYVPADTVMLFAGKSTEQVGEFMAHYELFNVAPTQIAVLSQLLGMGDTASKSKALMFFEALQENMFANKSYTYANLVDAVDLKADGAMFIYMYGATPVIKIELNDSAKVDALIADAIAQSGAQPTVKAFGEANIQSWVLKDGKNGGADVSLSVTTHNNVLTLAATVDGEADDVMQKRIGLVKTENNLAATDKVGKLKAKYNYTNNTVSYLDINGLAQSILNPQSTSMGRDLAKHAVNASDAPFGSQIPESCKKDFSAIFAAVPQLTFGYTKFDIKGNKAFTEGQMNIEITNQDVNNAIIAMRGHVPHHVSQSNKSIISFGTGIDVSALSGSVTKLWQLFTNAPFTCEQLVDAQNKVKQSNPAMLGFVLGQVRDVKGLGMSIYNVMMDGPSADAIISVASEDPAILASLTSMIPGGMLGDLQIAADGTPSKINLPMLPPSVEIFAAIKGKFLTVYTGEQGAKAADALSTETLEANGVYQLSFDYAKVSQTIAANRTSILATGPNMCIQLEETRDTLAAIDGNLTAGFDANTMGIYSPFAMNMNKPAQQSFALEGSYITGTLDDNCNFQEDGKQTFSADGTGSSNYVDPEEKCEVYNEVNTWKRVGNTLVTTPSSANERFSCDQPLAPHDEAVSGSPLEPTKCYLINETATSFQCVFDAGSSEPYIVEARKAG